MTAVFLWASTLHRCDLVRIQRQSFSRLIFTSGSMILTSYPDRDPTSESDAAAMVDFHVAGPWRPPEKWFVLPANAIGIRSGGIDDGYGRIERVCIIPLWLIVLPAAILPLVAGIRRWRRRSSRPWRGAAERIGRWARRSAVGASLLACCAVMLVWGYNLTWHGFEIDVFTWPAEIESLRPGVMQVYISTVPAAPHRTLFDRPESEDEWTGWIFRVLAPFSTRPDPDDTQGPRWQLFGGFAHEAVQDSGNGNGLFGPPQPSSRVIGHRWTIPYWSLFVLTAAYPEWRLFVRLRTWRRSVRWRAESRCMTCGYDLRATPGRCPECGAVVVG